MNIKRKFNENGEQFERMFKALVSSKMDDFMNDKQKESNKVRGTY